MGIAVVPKNPVDVAVNLKNPEGVAVDPKKITQPLASMASDTGIKVN